MKVPIVVRALGTVLKAQEKRLDGRNNGDHPDYSTVKDNKNT